MRLSPRLATAGLVASLALLWLSASVIGAQGPLDSDVRQEQIVVSLPTVLTALAATAAATWSLGLLMQRHVRRMERVEAIVRVLLARLDESDAKRELLRAEILVLAERLAELTPPPKS